MPAARQLRGVDRRLVGRPVIDDAFVVHPHAHAIIRDGADRVLSGGQIDLPFGRQRDAIARQPLDDRPARLVVERGPPFDLHRGPGHDALQGRGILVGPLGFSKGEVAHLPVGRHGEPRIAEPVRPPCRHRLAARTDHAGADVRQSHVEVDRAGARRRHGDHARHRAGRRRDGRAAHRGHRPRARRAEHTQLQRGGVRSTLRPELRRLPIVGAPLVDDDGVAAAPGRLGRHGVHRARQRLRQRHVDRRTRPHRHRHLVANPEIARIAGQGRDGPDLLEPVGQHADALRLGDLQRRGVALERIAGDDVVAAPGVARFGVAPVRVLRRVLPEMDRRLVAVEHVLGDPVVLPVLDRDGLDVPLEVIGRHPRVEAVAAPEPVPASLDAVAVEDVPAEGRFHAIGRREAEIVGVEHVVVRAPLARVHGGLAGPEEEAVAAVRHGIEGHDVPVALLVDEDAGRILTAVVEPLAVAADAEVDLVVLDRAAAGAIEPDADSRQEREVVVPDFRAVRAREHQAVLSLDDRRVVDFGVVGIGEVDAGTALEPLILLVVMVGHPVEEAFVLDETVQTRLPVVAEIRAGDMQPAAVPGQHTDLVPVRTQPLEGDVLAAVDQHRQSGEPVRIRGRQRAANRDAREIHGDVRAADDQRRMVDVGRPEDVDAGGNPGGLRDHHAGGRRLGRHGATQKAQQYEGQSHALNP